MNDDTTKRYTAQEIYAFRLSQHVPKYTWRVTGDHPTAKRPDKRFADEARAEEYMQELIKAGYENVAMEQR